MPNRINKTSPEETAAKMQNDRNLQRLGEMLKLPGFLAANPKFTWWVDDLQCKQFSFIWQTEEAECLSVIHSLYLSSPFLSFFPLNLRALDLERKWLEDSLSCSWFEWISPFGVAGNCLWFRVFLHQASEMES